MKKNIFVLTALIIIINVSCKTQFELAEPDMLEISEEYGAQNYGNGTLSILYLHKYYASGSSKDSTIQDPNSPNRACAFKQTFKYGIEYKLSSCDVQANGFNESIIFPKVTTPEAQKLIQVLFQDPFNTWTTDLTYEPEDAGCCYAIVQGEDKTTILIYCGG